MSTTAIADRTLPAPPGQKIRQIAEKLVLQDNQLKRYGPEARQARELQRQAISALIGRIWGKRAVQSPTGAPYQPGMEGDLVFAAIEALAPQNDAVIRWRGDMRKLFNGLGDSTA